MAVTAVTPTVATLKPKYQQISIHIRKSK